MVVHSLGKKKNIFRSQADKEELFDLEIPYLSAIDTVNWNASTR